MVRHTIFAIDLTASLVSLFIHLQNAQQAENPRQGLQQVAKSERNQSTSIAVSNTGRIFVRSDQRPYSVVEVMKDGSIKPCSDEQWNPWKAEGKSPSAAKALCPSR